MDKIQLLKHENETYLYIKQLKNKIKQINIKNNKIKITYLSENKREYILTEEQLKLLKDVKLLKINELSEDNILSNIYFVNLFFDF